MKWMSLASVAFHAPYISRLSPHTRIPRPHLLLCVLHMHHVPLCPTMSCRISPCPIIVRSMLVTALNPQEVKNKIVEKKIDCWSVSLWSPSGIPREQNKELTTTWASIYITLHEVKARPTCDAQSEYQSAKLKEHVRSTVPQYVTCHRMFQRVPWSRAIDKIKR